MKGISAKCIYFVTFGLIKEIIVWFHFCYILDKSLKAKRVERFILFLYILAWPMKASVTKHESSCARGCRFKGSNIVLLSSKMLIVKIWAYMGNE